MDDMLNNMKLAAPAADEVLVQLLIRWASAGRQQAPDAVRPSSQPARDDHKRADSPALPGSPSVLEAAERPSKRARLQYSAVSEESVSEDMVSMHASVAECTISSAVTAKV